MASTPANRSARVERPITAIPGASSRSRATAAAPPTSRPVAAPSGRSRATATASKRRAPINASASAMDPQAAITKGRPSRQSMSARRDAVSASTISSSKGAVVEGATPILPRPFSAANRERLVKLLEGSDLEPAGAERRDGFRRRHRSRQGGDAGDVVAQRLAPDHRVVLLGLAAVRCGVHQGAGTIDYSVDDVRPALLNLAHGLDVETAGPQEGAGAGRRDQAPAEPAQALGHRHEGRLVAVVPREERRAVGQQPLPGADPGLGE